MKEILLNLIVWTLLVILGSALLILASRKSEEPERKRAMIPAYVLVLTMGYFLGWATSSKKLPLAFAVFVSGAVLLWLYYRHLEKKGHVLEDERTLRIEEIASRRTLQVAMIVLAFTTIYLSIAQVEKPELRPAFKLTSGLLAILLLLHWGLINYYSRRM
nr:DUF2178 domain-containing protein [Thermococcus gammatolerans]